MSKKRLIAIGCGVFVAGILLFFLGFLVATGLKIQGTVKKMDVKMDAIDDRLSQMEDSWRDLDLSPKVSYIQSSGGSPEIDWNELERLIDSRTNRNSDEFKKMAEEYLRAMGEEKAKTPSLNALYEVWLKEAREAIRIEKYGESHNWLNKILTLDGGFPDALALKGFSLMCENRYDMSNYKAVKDYADKALERDSTNALALFNKGWVAEMLEEYSEAVRFYDMALALDPGNRFFLERKTDTLLAGNRGDEALGVLEQMVLVDPNNEALRLRHAESLYILSRYEESQSELAHLSGYTSDPNILVLRRKISQKTGDKKEELRVLRIIRDKGTGDFESLLRLANLCYEEKLYDEALPLFNSLLGGRKSKEIPKFTRADMVEKAMKLNCLVNNYQKAYDLYLFNDDVRRSGTMFYYALALKGLGKYSESRQVFSTLLERDYSGEEFEKELADLDRIQGVERTPTSSMDEVSTINE